MEHVLPAGWPVRLCQIQPVWGEVPIQEVGDSLGHHHDPGNVFLRGGPDVGCVGPGNDKGVAFRRLSAIEECKRAFILRHDVGGRIASDDLAEDAVAHGSSMAASPRV